MDGERDELLLCPIRVPRKYLLCRKQYCPEVSNLFVSTTKRRNRCPKTPFGFGLVGSSGIPMGLLLKGLQIVLGQVTRSQENCYFIAV